MTKSLCALLFSVFMASFAFADDHELFVTHDLQNPESQFEYNGRIRIEERYDQLSNGENRDNLRTGYRFNARLNLDREGCVQLHGRVASGARYNSESDHTGIGDRDRNFNIGFRHLYLQANCLRENVIAELGAMHVDSIGRLGPAPNGWVDGFRVIVEEENSGRRWSATIGEVDDLNETNFYQRDFGDINFKEIKLQQDFGHSDQHTVIVVVSEFEDDLYLRTGLNLAVQRYFGFVNSVGGEVLLNEDEAVGSYFDIRGSYKKWNGRLVRTNIETDFSDPGVELRANAVTRDYYGQGENYLLELYRPLGNSRRYSTMIRLRDGDAGRMAVLRLTRYFNR